MFTSCVHPSSSGRDVSVATITQKRFLDFKRKQNLLPGSARKLIFFYVFCSFLRFVLVLCIFKSWLLRRRLLHLGGGAVTVSCPQNVLLDLLPAHFLFVSVRLHVGGAEAMHAGEIAVRLCMSDDNTFCTILLFFLFNLISSKEEKNEF